MNIFSGHRFSVDVNEVTLPNGIKMNLESVHSSEVVVILPLLKEGKIILLKQFRPVINEWLYELPAGLIDKGEKPIDAARRELKEETGFNAKELKEVTKVFSSPGFSNEYAHMFIASDLETGEQKLEPTENINVLKVPLKKAVKMVKSGTIKNVHSVALLMLFYNDSA